MFTYSDFGRIGFGFPRRGPDAGPDRPAQKPIDDLTHPTPEYQQQTDGPPVSGRPTGPPDRRTATAAMRIHCEARISPNDTNVADSYRRTRP